MNKNIQGFVAKILLVWIVGLIGIPNVEGNNLDDVVKELSAVGRLLNGIAMQNDFTEHPENTKKVIAEFLEVPKAELLDELNTLNLDDLYKNITVFHSAINGIPAMKTKDISSVHKCMGLLENMKKQDTILKLTKSDSPEAQITKSIDSSKSTEIRSKFATGNFDVVIQKLREVKPNTRAEYGLMGCKKIFDALQSPLTVMLQQWSDLKAYETTFKEVFKLKDIISTLNTTFKYAKFAKDYRTNLTTFLSLSDNVVNVKTDLNSLTAMATQNHDLRNLKTSLVAVNEYLKKAVVTNNEKLTKSLTVGFPKSSAEIGLLTDDFEKSKMLKELSDGKSWKGQIRLMSQLLKFHVEMKKLERSWRYVSQDNVLSSFEEVISRIDESLPFMEHLPAITGESSVIDSISGCVGGLAKPTETFDFVKFEELKTLASEIGFRVSSVNNELRTIATNGTFDEAFQKLQMINNQVNRITNKSDLDLYEAPFMAIENDSDLLKTADVLEAMKPRLEWFATPEALGGIEKQMDWTMLTRVFQTLDGTKISTTLNCLKQINYSEKALLGLMNLLKNTVLTKEKDEKLNIVSKSLATLLKIIKQLATTQQVVAKTRTRREVQQLLKFKKCAQIALDAERGLESLRSLSEILKKGSTIEELFEESHTLHVVAEASNNVWNSSNRNMLWSAVFDLKTLDDFAAALKGGSLEEMWSVFAEAQKVEGPEIEAKLLAKPIAEDIRLDYNPIVRKGAVHFEQLSDLDLRFQSHKTRFKSASLALTGIREYFDGVFGISRHNSENGVKNPLYLTLIVACGISTILILVIGGYFGYKRIRTTLIEKENWKNRERLWIYFGRIDMTERLIRNMDEDWNSLPSFQAMVKVDAYWKGETLLHAAVRHHRPINVEMLIKAGANRMLVNDGNKTAEDLCKVKARGDGEGDKKENRKAAECAAVFAKYASKKFKQMTPKQKPWEEFRCSFLSDDEQFVAQFATYRTQACEQSFWPYWSHCVVDVDDHGVFDIDQFRGKTDELSVLTAMHKVFSPIVLVSTAWAKLVLEDPKNFTLDYEHRVTKVRYLGVVYETVDEWKRWIRGEMISCCHNMYCYYSSSDKSGRAMFTSTARLIFSRVVESAEKVAEELARTDRPAPYWNKKEQRMVVIKPDAEDESTAELLPKEILSRCEVMTSQQFWSWLLSMNGCKGLVMPVAGQPATVSATSSATPVADAAKNPDKKSKKKEVLRVQ